MMKSKLGEVLRAGLISRLLLGCTLILSVSHCMAQVDTGTVLGTVKDQQGAVIPDARITITNLGTGSDIVTMTRSDGTYIVTPLKIGTYRVSIAVAGFKKEQSAPFDLNIQQQAVMDFTLQTGATTETVQVTAQVPLLQTQNATVGQVIGGHVVESMPLNGRDWTMLATPPRGHATAAGRPRGEPVRRERYPPGAERLPP